MPLTISDTLKTLMAIPTQERIIARLVTLTQ